jgi:hypothetical protein
MLQGSLVGAKGYLSGGFVPWDWLEVEWADGSLENNFVNPWDIEVVNTRFHSGKRDGKRPKM